MSSGAAESEREKEGLAQRGGLIPGERDAKVVGCWAGSTHPSFSTVRATLQMRDDTTQGEAGGRLAQRGGLIPGRRHAKVAGSTPPWCTGYAASPPISGVKRRPVTSLLAWVTACTSSLVSLFFFFFSFRSQLQGGKKKKKKNSFHFSMVGMKVLSNLAKQAWVQVHFFFVTILIMPPVLVVNFTAVLEYKYKYCIRIPVWRNNSLFFLFIYLFFSPGYRHWPAPSDSPPHPSLLGLVHLTPPELLRTHLC